MSKYINICFLFLSITIFSQDKKMREYFYKAPHYYENICLFNDGSFKYLNRTEFIKNEITGSWKLKNDTVLVLTSYPKKDKLKVSRSLKKNKKNIFNVTDSEGDPFVYHLYLIYNKDTIILRDQFQKTASKDKLNSFYIVSPEGIYSPVYHVEKPTNNLLNIKFERKRVFDNEEWKFEGNKIIPLGLDGKYSKYELKLNN